MDGTKYLLWHCQKQGWVTTGGTSTVLSDASRFTLEQAQHRVRLQKDYDGNHTVIPVYEGDL